MRLARPAALAVAFAALACAAAAAPPAPTAPTPLLGGGVVRPGEGRGIVHFVFVARWCGPCEAEMQALRRLAARMRRADYQLVVVGVARRESPAEFAACWPWPISAPKIWAFRPPTPFCQKIWTS